MSSTTNPLSPLDEQSLWVGYKSTVWTQDSPQADTVHNILRVLRAIRFKQLAYVSVPITSGRYLYNLLLECHGLYSQCIEEAMAYNYSAGWDFVRQLAAKLSLPVLFPADLTPIHQQWEQDHFQALWLSIIAELCTEVHMSAGWNFSNGGAEELAHVFQLRLGIPHGGELCYFNTKRIEDIERHRMQNILVFDHAGHPVTIDDAIRLLEESTTWITGHDFEAPKLIRCLGLLRSTRDLLAAGYYQ